MAFLKSKPSPAELAKDDEDTFKVGDVVYLITDFDGNWPMTVTSVGGENIFVFWFAAGGRGQSEMFPPSLLEKAETY